MYQVYADGWRVQEPFETEEEAHQFIKDVQQYDSGALWTVENDDLSDLGLTVKEQRILAAQELHQSDKSANSVMQTLRVRLPVRVSAHVSKKSLPVIITMTRPADKHELATILAPSGNKYGTI